MIEVRNAAFSYRHNDAPVFSDLNFRLEPGRILCILGPNGTGKSTLIKCLAGLIELKTGEISIEGRGIRTMGRRALALRVAYVPQMHQPVFAYSVYDFVLMGRAPHIGTFSSPSTKDRQKADQALRTLGLDRLAAKPYTEISGGERQLVMFARVLAQSPGLLLLDEPTSHLDFGNQVLVLSLIKSLAEQGLTIIMTSHFPDHALLASDQAAIMSQGRFQDFGPPDEVITEDRLSRVYGIRVRIISLDGEVKVCAPVIPKSYDRALAAMNGGPTGEERT